jgi:hypothetical protein
LQEKAGGALKELDKRDSVTRAGQIDCPHVVQRNAREKRMDAQGKPFEFLASELRHDGPFKRQESVSFTPTRHLSSVT